ncbi:MAG: MarR family transcriptional regulator [Methanobrevibacter arboriphilus]|uniref:MarR family transcriptional regulator n=1 Tax=Methanobrevibacter arboriphilus TaxID=39441 RepID=A0A843AJZ8_METAZ|nr:winged helix-turn-helix domain-containing protein [Methanobrevibacter arboriphilus]MBF4467868.1 MarR family transcriptional regulator [Methanobrevibacter arboriphilus]
MERELIEGIAIIQRSKCKEIVLRSLNNGIKMPSKISKETEISIHHVSRYLKQLKEKHLVICLNEDYKQGRLYEITDLGKEVLKYIE